MSRLKLSEDLETNRFEIEYIFSELVRNYGVVATPDATRIFSLSISSGEDGEVMVNPDNLNLTKGKNFEEDFSKDGYMTNRNGTRDWISTAFFLISCAQELDATKSDRFGRFPFDLSYQKYFGCVTRNVVQHCFDELVGSTPSLKGMQKPIRKSKVFVSHDVDTVYGALLQDGFFALKRFNPVAMANVILSNLLSGPQWLNMDKIMRIEDESGFRSTFYWLVNKGITKDGFKNSDYAIGSKTIQKQIRLVQEKGWENGLHKSISEDSFAVETNKLGLIPLGNRYHFLKFRPHNNFKEIEAAGLQFDTSLGFAEEMGFRNSYGLPYKPFDFESRKSHTFVECPLHIMDTTLHGYRKISADEAFRNITAFMESNPNDVVFSVLWHNNYFTEHKYGDYYKLYKKLLTYFVETKYECITQSQIVDEYQ